MKKYAIKSIELKLKQIRFTQEGLEKLKQEYEDLLKQRPAVVEDLKKAREMGDLKENGYYKASRMKLSSIDHRLFRLKLDIKQAVIVDSSNKDSVSIGSVVTISDGKKEITYTIVGDLEAEPSKGKISLLSPLGRALEGKQIEQTAQLTTPSGQISYKIIKIT